MSMATEPVRPRHDWSARARISAQDAMRYTKFVTRMRRVTALSAFAVIFTVLAFFFVARAPRQAQFSYERLGTLENDLSMDKPRLSGVDDNGNPFVITAKVAVQDAKNPKRATLKIIEGDFSDGKAGWYNARAGGGVIDMATGQVDLDGGIDVFTDGGYTLHTQSASLNLHANIVHGHQTVSGQGPRGAMKADTFHYDRQGGQLILEGHVQTVINGKPK